MPDRADLATIAAQRAAARAARGQDDTIPGTAEDDRLRYVIVDLDEVAPGEPVVRHPTDPDLFVGGTQVGIELGHAQITSTVTLDVGANTDADVTGLSVPVTVAERPVLVEAYVPVVTHTAVNGVVQWRLYEDATLIQTGQTAPLGTPGQGPSLNLRVRRNPPAGAHTYKLVMRSPTAGTLTAIAAAVAPGWIGVVER